MRVSKPSNKLPASKKNPKKKVTSRVRPAVNPSDVVVCISDIYACVTAHTASDGRMDMRDKPDVLEYLLAFVPRVPANMRAVDVDLPRWFGAVAERTCDGSYYEEYNAWVRVVNDLLAPHALAGVFGNYVRRGKQRFSPTTGELSTILLWMVLISRNGDTHSATFLLQKWCANPNARMRGEPILVRALRTGQLEFAKTLIKHRADVNPFCTKSNEHATNHASQASPAAIRMLVECRADPTVVGCDGLNAIASALKSAVGERVESQLSVVEYLISHGVDPNAQHSASKGVFALLEVRPSCECGQSNCNPEVLQRMVQMGASPDLKTLDGKRISVCGSVLGKLVDTMKQFVFEQHFKFCKTQHKKCTTIQGHSVLCDECTARVKSIGFGNRLAISTVYVERREIQLLTHSKETIYPDKC